MTVCGSREVSLAHASPRLPRTKTFLQFFVKFYKVVCWWPRLWKILNTSFMTTIGYHIPAHLTLTLPRCVHFRLPFYVNLPQGKPLLIWWLVDFSLIKTTDRQAEAWPRKSARPIYCSNWHQIPYLLHKMRRILRLKWGRPISLIGHVVKLLTELPAFHQRQQKGARYKLGGESTSYSVTNVNLMWSEIQNVAVQEIWYNLCDGSLTDHLTLQLNSVYSQLYETLWAVKFINNPHFPCKVLIV